MSLLARIAPKRFAKSETKHAEISRYIEEIKDMKANNFQSDTIDIAEETLRRLLEKAEH